MLCILKKQEKKNGISIAMKISSSSSCGQSSKGDIFRKIFRGEEEKRNLFISHDLKIPNDMKINKTIHSHYHHHHYQ